MRGLLRITLLNTRMKETKIILLSFLVPFFLMILASVALLIIPFGKHNFAISDGGYYIDYLLFFNRLLKGQESILYSFKNGLGGNELSTLAWGCFSIGGFLSAFATLETMPTWFTWITLVNISVCGLTMYILLAGIKGHRFSHLIFSTSYSLMGFCVAYCYHYIFFIGPQMLPLVILGLIWIFRKENPLLYILSLSICILLNFYFGFMLCVASVTVFLAYYIAGRKMHQECGMRLFITYTLSSIIAGLLPAFVWLPTIKAFTGGGRLNQTGLDEFLFSENMPFIRMFSKLFSGAISLNEEVSGFPNIFCGILIVSLVFIFFRDKRINPLWRKAAALVLAFYLISFYIVAFSIFMHGGTHTNWFPYRYSFVFSFLLICIAFEEYQYLDEITLHETKKAGFIIVIATLIVFSVQYEFVSAGSLLLDFGLLFLMWIGFYLYKTRPEKAPRSILSAFLLLLVCCNLYANFVMSIGKLRDWEKDLTKYNENILTSGAIVQALSEHEEVFFRMEKDESESGSSGYDPYLYGYNGVSHSGPTEREFIHRGLSRIGINWYDMRHWYEHGVTAATDALLGLKYLVSKNDLKAEKDYEALLDANGTLIYRNSKVLPIAILADEAFHTLTLQANAFENLNVIWSTLAGDSEPIFTSEDDVTFTLHNNTDGQTITSRELQTSLSKTENGENTDIANTAYIEYVFTAQKDAAVYRFDSSVPDSENGKAIPTMVCCGVYNAGDTVTGVCETNAEYLTPQIFTGYCSKLKFAYADNEMLAKFSEIINSRDISFNMVKETNLSGSFTAEPDQRILFTIPWDEGWTCYIDGQEVSIDKTWDLFMSVEVPEGQHTWEMKFFPAWMNYGILISSIALMGLVAIIILWKKKKHVVVITNNTVDTEVEKLKETDRISMMNRTEKHES